MEGSKTGWNPQILHVQMNYRPFIEPFTTHVGLNDQNIFSDLSQDFMFQVCLLFYYQFFPFFFPLFFFGIITASDCEKNSKNMKLF